MTLRPDLAVIAGHVAQGSRVLDIGCGDGALMAALRDQRGCDARGLELDAGNVAAAVGRGLSVIQGDADIDLAAYPDRSFDYAILSQTLQTARAPDVVLDHLLRIGRRAFVSFPNFAQWRIRLSLLWGITPMFIADIENADRLVKSSESLLIGKNCVQKGDLVVLVIGMGLKAGSTNIIKLHRVGHED